MLRLMILLAAAGLTIACGNGRGKFAFTVADHTGLPALEQRFFQPQRFVRYGMRPIFERDDVIWYAYRPVSPKPGKYYGISLQKKSLGYQEIDLRNRTIADGQGMLIDHYRSLEEGEYRMKIAYDNQVIDQIDFIIVADSASESIDFETDEPEGNEA
ncbi:MAG: hypothetical protein JNJ69_17050 [Leptospiraceae bacterium]|nr:hypothetical protein [Leptospiraceae bacterium]